MLGLAASITSCNVVLRCRPILTLRTGRFQAEKVLHPQPEAERSPAY